MPEVGESDIGDGVGKEGGFRHGEAELLLAGVAT